MQSTPPDLTPSIPFGTDRAVSLAQAAGALPDLWSPRILGQIRGHHESQYIKVVRILGDFPWHTHTHQDELFLVLSGCLHIGRALEDGGDISVYPGQFFIVPRGTRHNTSATIETHIVLIEPASTAHTGSEITPLTRSLADQLG